jgi:hypothetical protein
MRVMAKFRESRVAENRFPAERIMQESRRQRMRVILRGRDRDAGG